MIIDLVAGTRPEVVKLAPVYTALRAIPGVTPRWIATGQHGFLADQALDVFGIEPDVRIALDWDRSSLPSLTAKLMESLGVHFRDNPPDYVLCQGDTATAFSAAQAAFLSRIPVGHVEAGLRSADISSPFPEEGFRQLIARIATDHFAPTAGAARNLYREGIDANHASPALKSARRLLVVTDQGVRGLGLLDAALEGLQADGYTVHVYDKVVADPPESVIFEAVSEGREFKAEAVIGFGGGSPMDTAKVVALLLGSEQPLDDMYVGVPVVIGAGGAEKIVEISLNADEQKMFDHSVGAVKGLVKACKDIDPSLA